MQEDSDFLKELFTHVSKKIAKPYAALASMEEEYIHRYIDYGKIGMIPQSPSTASPISSFKK